MVRPEYPPQVAEIMARLERAGHAAYLVGGALRDAMLGRGAHDFDVTTSALPHQMTEVFSDYPVIETGLKHGTLTVLADGLPIEITTFRIDGEYRDARHPEAVTFTDRIEDDLARRDFTVNAMAYNPSRGLVDVFGGEGDLASGVIRAVRDPHDRFREDALRILRAFRFMSKLDFQIEPHTLSAARDCREELTKISAERITAELCGLFEGRAAEAALVAMAQSGIWQTLAPELSISPSNAKGIDALPRRFEVRFAYFVRQTSDGGESLIRRLRLSNASRGHIHVLLSLRGVSLLPPSSARVRRLLAAAGAYVDDAEALLSADGFFDLTRADADQILAMVRQARQGSPCLSLSALAIDGRALMAVGFQGREIGTVLAALLERVLDDPDLNRPEALLSMAEKMKNQKN